MTIKWTRDEYGSYTAQVGPTELLVFRGGHDAIVRLNGWSMHISNCGGVKYAKVLAVFRLRHEMRPLYEALKELYGDD